MKLPNLEKIRGKGEPITIFGGTGHGKSSIVNSLIDQDDDEIMEIANLRIADGKGTVESTDIILTNYPTVPKKALVLTGEFKTITPKDVFDDNEMLVTILYLATKDYNNAINKNDKDPKEAFESGVSNYLLERIDRDKDNTSLSYRLRNIYVQELTKIVMAINEFNPELLNQVFVEAKNNNETNTKDEMEIFKSKLLEYSKSILELDEQINGFWTAISEYFNAKCEEYIKQIDNFNSSKGYEYGKNKDNKSFEMVVEKSDMDNEERKEIIQILMNSEDRATEFLINNFTIYINISFEKFDCNLNYFQVVKENNNYYYVLHLIDTMGLFHKDGVKIREEKERIVDICSKTHSSNIIIVIKADKDAIVKDSLDAFTDFVKNSKKNINVFMVYTHFDKYLTGWMNSSSNQFKRVDIKDKKSIVEKAENGIKDIYSNFIDETSNEVNPKKKPQLINYSIFSYWTHDDSIDALIEEKGFNYVSASRKLIGYIANTNSTLKYVVNKVPKKPYVLSFNGKNKLNVKDIYQNIIYNKDLCNNIYSSVHWKTAVAAITNWCDYGDKFISNAKGRDTGYSKIETNFVEYIRNFIKSLVLKNIGIVIDGWEVGEIDDMDRDFIGELYRYLGDNLGREVAMQLGKEVYKETKFSYYSAFMFRDMINNLQTNYFMYPDISINELSKIYAVLESSMLKTIDDFLSYRCVEVY